MLDDEFDFETEDTDAPGNNLTPMIDVIFILLVFFLCVSQIKTGKMKIDIPTTEAKTADSETTAKAGRPVTIEIAADGRIAIDKKMCKDLNDAKLLISDLANTRGKDILIAVRGDKKADFGKVVQVLALLSGAGLKNLEIEFDPKGNS